MTNTTQHTPGPWHSVQKDYGSEINTKQGERIAYCTDDFIDNPIYNAILIAAAPELLEALEALRDRALRDAEAQGLNDNAPIYAFIQGATDAIAKARGQA